MNLSIETDSVTVGIPIDKLDKIANSLIKKRTTNTSMLSFAAGMPGGVTMAATIPADTLLGVMFGVEKSALKVLSTNISNC